MNKIPTSEIHQTFKIKATPENVMQCLLDDKIHSKITDSKCTNYSDGRFEAYDGVIKGKTLEHILNTKLVQEWWYDKPGWPEETPSILSLTFKQNGKYTEVIFDQVKVPSIYHDEFADGWKEFYWEPMKKMLEK